MQRHFSRASMRRRPSFSRKRRNNKVSHIDTSRFINKAVIEEQVEQFTPEHSFVDFNISDSLKTNILNKGYKTPTPIQDQSIPHVLNGSDIVGIANTGTGKTAAFLIPLINKVVNNPGEKILIVVPTRELGLQINKELYDLTAKLRIYSVCTIGGMSIGRQAADLRRKYNFIIGTPGRIKDFIKRKSIDMSRFNTVVLDEADRMLDMGFIKDMKLIMNQMPKNKQTLFFSATLSNDIKGLIGDFLNNPVTVSVKTRDTSKNVDQDVIRIQRGENKIHVLEKLLDNKSDFKKVLIFGRTKHGVEKLSKNLVFKGFKVGSIHGNKNHSQRQKALGLFKDNRIQALVATDVAARGIDIADITHVINYDIPSTYEDYIHRIGRTGRGDKSGKALTFVE